MKLSQLDDLASLRGLLLGEAEGEDFIGNVLVACVVRTRLQDKRWPDTWKEVIFQKGQFSCMDVLPRDGDIQLEYVKRYFTHRWDNRDFREAHFAAWGVLCNWYVDVAKGANHYHADWMKEYPYWSEGQTPVLHYGKHIFYKL